MIQKRMRRDRLEILINILEICSKDEANKTKIVYQTNINFRVANLYLDMLVKEDLVKVVNPGPRERYVTTKNGMVIIEKVKQVYDCMELYSIK